MTFSFFGSVISYKERLDNLVYLYNSMEFEFDTPDNRRKMLEWYKEINSIIKQDPSLITKVKLINFNK